MTFEIPADLNPDLMGLAWLRGRWEGTGFRSLPGEKEPQPFHQQVDFADNGGNYLHYLAQAFEVDEDGRPSRPLFMETGFWRPLKDATLDVVMCSPEGYAEIWYGTLQPGRADMTTDAVVRSPDAEVEYTAGRRLYGLVDGKLMYSFDRATTQHSLQPYVWATLVRA